MSVSTVSPSRQTFRKNERLSSRKIIESLAHKGNKIHVPPLRLLWNQHSFTNNFPVQVAFSVPKKKIKKAVDRNRIRRRMREAYRKNKSNLYALIPNNKKQYALLFVYTGKESISYLETEEKTKSILKLLVEDIKKDTD